MNDRKPMNDRKSMKNRSEFSTNNKDMREILQDILAELQTIREVLEDAQ